MQSLPASLGFYATITSARSTAALFAACRQDLTPYVDCLQDFTQAELVLDLRWAFVELLILLQLMLPLILLRCHSPAHGGSQNILV